MIILPDSLAKHRPFRQCRCYKLRTTPPTSPTARAMVCPWRLSPLTCTPPNWMSSPPPPLLPSPPLPSHPHQHSLLKVCVYRRVSLASSYGYLWPPLSPDDSSSPVGSVDTTSYFISTMAIPALPSKTFSVSFPNSKKVLWLFFCMHGHIS